MNILQVHNKYRFRGGEGTVFNQEFELLRSHHHVEQFIVDNRRELNSRLRQLRLLFTTYYNRRAKRKIGDYLSRQRFDVMHVHNFFPLLSPSIFEAAREAGVPSVMTLHNYRLIHPNGLLYHNKKIDERSIRGSAYRCVPDGVYRNSVLQTAVVAHMIEYHRRKKTWDRLPSAFIALSAFSREKFVEGGLPGDRIFIKPNFLKDPVDEFQELQLREVKEDLFLYVGRISVEKGVADLVDYWMESDTRRQLVLAGDGPLREELRRKTRGNRNITWMGHLSRRETLGRLSTAKALLFPSKWYEGQPLILLEAMSVGCPVIAFKLGNPRNIVQHEKTGYHVDPGNFRQMGHYLSVLDNDSNIVRQLSRNARQQYLRHYTPETNYRQLLEIYREAARLEKKLT